MLLFFRCLVWSFCLFDCFVVAVVFCLFFVLFYWGGGGGCCGFWFLVLLLFFVRFLFLVCLFLPGVDDFSFLLYCLFDFVCQTYQSV